MEPATSPTKRRALTSRDANALPSPRPASLKPVLSPIKDAEGNRKRGIDMVASAVSPLKKLCREDDARSRSQSPCSSVFDVSGHDSSWANTTATEPDTSPVPRAMTREQAREKAEILRLRLGLASYKFRTGQTMVPLANLERKHILPRQRREELSGLQLGEGSIDRKERELDARRRLEGDERKRPEDAAGADETLPASSRALGLPHATPATLRGGQQVDGGLLRGQAAAAADLLSTVRAALDP